jgi:chromosome segregation ATPase
MELLKQLEVKLQALVQQRNQLREELEKVRADHGSVDEEMNGLRRRLEDLQSEKSTLVKERDEVRQQVEDILKLLEDMA